MENKIEQLWLNQEAGLLIKASFLPGTDMMVGCVGKKVEIEGCEFDMVSIEGNYYEIVGNLHGLDLIRATDDLAYVNKSWESEYNLKRARATYWDKTYKKLFDLLWDELDIHTISRMTDTAVEGAFAGKGGK